jgi:hypothetical protein
MGFVAHRACCLAAAAINAEVERHGLVLSQACHGPGTALSRSFGNEFEQEGSEGNYE